MPRDQGDVMARDVALDCDLRDTPGTPILRDRVAPPCLGDEGGNENDGSRVNEKYGHGGHGFPYKQQLDRMFVYLSFCPSIPSVIDIIYDSSIPKAVNKEGAKDATSLEVPDPTAEQHNANENTSCVSIYRG